MNILNTFKYFLSKNPIKIIFFLIFGTLFYLSYRMDPIDVKIVKPIYSFAIGDNAHYYTYLENNNPHTVLSQDDLDKNKKLTIKEVNDVRGLCITITFIILFMLFITSFSNDSDVNWEIKDVIANHRISNVETEMENNIYTYTYKGKLLFETTYRTDSSHLKDIMVTFLKNPNLFPDYETKKSRRKRLLSDI